LKTMRRVMPHIEARVVDGNGSTLHRGVAGELCTNRHALQKGYWQNQAKVDEVRVRNAESIIFLHYFTPY